MRLKCQINVSFWDRGLESHTRSIFVLKKYFKIYFFNGLVYKSSFNINIAGNKGETVYSYKPTSKPSYKLFKVKKKIS